MALVGQQCFLIGKPGCVLSRACTELFSSTLNTTAFSGGFRYNPTTSCSFSSNRGSLLTLKGIWLPGDLPMNTG